MVFFLIGFMGSGKSHWGKIWAKQYGLSFIDLDEMIEKDAGKTITEIFKLYGEAYFRELETATLKKIQLNLNTIVACGGGTPCFNDNLNWMNENGITVYLRSSAGELADRLLPQKESRPLIKNLSMDQLILYIENKLSERALFYDQAKANLDTNKLQPDSFSNLMTMNK